MKYLILFAYISISIIVSSQTANNCNGAVSGCTTPSFAIMPNNPSTNIVDFSSGSISNPSTNPNCCNSGCLLSGETSSTFISIAVVSSGTLAWSIIGPSGGCFDWIMWAMPNANQTQACAGINGNSLPPVACNWNGTCNGNTGMAPAGQLPPNGSPSSYEAPLNVIAGQSYMLCLSNYSGTSQNVNLNFFGTAQVACGVSAPDQTICQGNSATVNIATPGYTNPVFNWLVTTGVSNTSSGSNVIVTPNVTTTYQVEVTQTTPPLSGLAEFTITVVPPPVPNAGIDDSVCLGQPIYLSGSISNPANTASWQYLTTGITPTPTVSFAPNFNSLTPTVTVNQTGLYQFILRENNAVCGIVGDTVLVLVSQIAQTTTSINPSCSGFADGEIQIDSPFADEYSFDNGVTWQVDSFAVGFAAGTYPVCSRNAQGCSVCSNVTITNPALVTISMSNDTLICENGTAQLLATASGGTTYQYHWGHSVSTQALQPVSPSVNTMYYAYAENENGCISSTDSVMVTIRNPLSGNISPDITICPGYPTPLTAGAIGGIGAPFTFVWNTAESGSGSSHTISANPPSTATYTVTITDNCETSPLILSTNVTVAPLPVPLIATDLDNKCEPATFNLTNETDPSMVDLVYWELSDGQIFVNQSTILTDEMWSGLYDVQLIVTSPQGCVDSATFNNFLSVHPKPIADFRHNPNPVYMFNPQVQLTNYSVNGDTYQWYIEFGNPSYSELKHLQTTFPDGTTGQYEVTLITTSEFGCIDTATQIVVVFPEIILFVPNAFTPDNDEFNQSWGIHIDGIDIYDFELLVFNRWGEIIWESHDPDARWDGTYGGKYVEQGTYTWVIRAKDMINDGKYEYNGFVTILK